MKELANEFARWLERHGAQLKPVTSQWEAVRWSPQDSTMTHVMYLNKKEKESFSSEGARQVWVRFLEDEDEVPQPGTILTVTGETDSSNLGWPQGGPAPDLTLFAGGIPAVVKPNPRPVYKAPAAEQLIVQPVREVFLSTGADVHDEQGRWVATIHGVNGAEYKEIDSFVANCWLIGAAPQMLAALKMAAEATPAGEYSMTRAEFAQIQQAIDLATKGPQA